MVASMPPSPDGGSHDRTNCDGVQPAMNESDALGRGASPARRTSSSCRSVNLLAGQCSTSAAKQFGQSIVICIVEAGAWL